MRSFATLLSLIICGTAFAAETPAVPPAKAPPKAGRTCRVLFLAAPENAPKTIFLNDGASTQPIELPSLNLSNVYKLSPGDITLRLTPTLPTEQQPIPVGAPMVAVPEAVKDFYLLVSSDPKNPVAPLKCQVVNANPEGFRSGQMMWLNLTPYQVGGQLGSRTLNLKPNSQSLVDSPKDSAGSYSVKIGYNPGKDQKPALIVSTEWPHNPSGRNIVFVMMLPNSKIPRIKGFSDYREPQKAQ